MNWLITTLSSTVGRKFVMGLTGLFLCFFLVVHLAGNLLLYVGPEAYDHYAHTLHEQKGFLVVAEVLLFGAFIVHILLAIKLSRSNYAARQIPYAKTSSKKESRLVANVVAPEAWMFWSGAVVLGFLILHLGDFKFELWWGTSLQAIDSPYDKAGVILRNSLRLFVYTLGSIVLGMHVSHGLASAFQSLGVNHPKYTPCIHWCSIAFGWIVGIGFASFPVIWSLTESAAAP